MCIVLLPPGGYPIAVNKYIISACPILAKEQYTKGHDRVCAELHFNMCKEIGLD
jgi:hypothetical protein